MRTTKGAARTRAKNRLFKSQGYVGGRRRRCGRQEALVGRCLRFPRPPRAKRDFRQLWIIRINAAVHRQAAVQRVHQRAAQAQIGVDRRCGRAGRNNPAGFDEVVAKVRQALSTDETASSDLRRQRSCRPFVTALVCRPMPLTALFDAGNGRQQRFGLFADLC